MEKWKEYRLGELCDTISDTYKRGAKEVVLINTSDVLDGKCLNHQKVANENLKGQFKKTFQYNDILYSEIRPANKRFAFVDFEATDYIASTKLMVLRHNEKITPQYLYYILKSQNVIDELQMLAESRSGTFPQITFSELSNLKVLLPNIKTQNKIISILSSLDDKIEVNRRINEQLEELAQALFKSWFVDFEPFKDGDFVERELGMIPKGWKVRRLDEVSKLIAGGDKPNIVSSNKTDDTPYPIYSNGIDNYGLYGYSDNFRIKEESVTVSARGTIGYVCLREEPYTPIVRLISIIPNADSVSAKFIYHSLKIKPIQGTGTTQQQLTVPMFRNTLLVVPPQEVMSSFTLKADSLFALRRKNQQEIRHLTTLRDTLLPKLMSGEIDVNEVEL